MGKREQTLVMPPYQIIIEKYIHPNHEEAKAFKLHSLIVRVVFKDDDLQADLDTLFSRQTYGLHLYRRAHYSWFPFWKRPYVSVMDKVDLKTLIFSTTSSRAMAVVESANAKFNISQLNGLNPAELMFFTESELNIAKPLIEKAIQRFLDKMISKGPYPENMRLFYLEF
ncbi:hypothetical protein [Paenibacillus agilis]|uniref:Uncharacterized protein n=1 Tax=Paenibacillus agilis TaxID=3020863 RepID=A0A559ID48_9BACL|nr:hypothetical protein [Paenibacillus agilis]TVX85592.1 hypothetical protein FPZ44_24870 [Paenibacillus agilis]